MIAIETYTKAFLELNKEVKAYEMDLIEDKDRCLVSRTLKKMEALAIHGAPYRDNINNPEYRLVLTKRKICIAYFTLEAWNWKLRKEKLN
jgi:hypothetical protein